MLEKLVIYNFIPRVPSSDSLKSLFGDRYFILKTCKRELVVGFSEDSNDSVFKKLLQDSSFFEMSCFSGPAAYQFLLEIICGLHSEIIAEHEIVKQFKDAYAIYRELKMRDTRLMKVIERLFMDSKDIRTKFLTKLGTNSYASLSRQLIFQNEKPQKVLIIGSGNLATDLINQLNGKVELFLSARNSESAQLLCQQFQIQNVAWKDYERWQTFDYIANTIGAPITLFDSTFFDVWQKLSSGKCFIDLGYPSVIETTLDSNSGVYRLPDVVAVASSKNIQKNDLINDAMSAIKALKEHRKEFFSKSN
jgi:glutamyl-tRNA reductase